MFTGSVQTDRMSSSGRLPHPYIKARVRGSRGSEKCALASLSVGSAATTAAVGQRGSHGGFSARMIPPVASLELVT